MIYWPVQGAHWSQLGSWKWSSRTWRRCSPMIAFASGASHCSKAESRRRWSFRLVRVVKVLYREKLTFLARGAGSGLSRGVVPQKYTVIIEMDRFKKIHDIDYINWTITVGPGVVNLRISEKVRPSGYHFVPDPLVNNLLGVKLVPLTESNWCCGSAGIYNLLQPELAGDVLRRKIDSVRETLEFNPTATTLVTGNPGCLYQIRAGIREAKLPLGVIHPAVYLTERLQG